jgi:hypothetical protein
MSSDEPANAAAAAAAQDTAPAAAPARKHWSTAELWMLGVFSAIGLIGFIATFVLLVMRTPGAPVQRALTATEIERLTGPRGERGPAGPPGARGPAGEPGLRLVRTECTAAGCVAECADDEVLLSAYCSPNRGPVTYPTEHSAACRPQLGRGRVEVVAACMKAARR